MPEGLRPEPAVDQVLAGVVMAVVDVGATALVVVDGSVVVDALDEVVVDGSVVVDALDEVVVDGSVLSVVDDGTVVVVDGTVVVVGGRLVVVDGAVVVVLASASSSAGASVVAGPMLPRSSGAFSMMPGNTIEVGDSGVVSGTVSPPIWAAGSRCSEPTLTASNANGAATAAAVTVDSDSASQNRPRPVASPGRCRYIYESELEGLTVADFGLTLVLAQNFTT